MHCSQGGSGACETWQTTPEAADLLQSKCIMQMHCASPRTSFVAEASRPTCCARHAPSTSAQEKRVWLATQTINCHKIEQRLGSFRAEEARKRLLCSAWRQGRCGLDRLHGRPAGSQQRHTPPCPTDRLPQRPFQRPQTANWWSSGPLPLLPPSPRCSQPPVLPQVPT